MAEIYEIDRNIAVSGRADTRGIVFGSVLEGPFDLRGLINAFPFSRIPRERAQIISERTVDLNGSTAGGRVRFRTDSKRIVLRALMRPKYTFPHMTFLGTSCFDVYEKSDGEYRFCGNFMSEPGRPELFESELVFNEKKTRDLMIELPLYDGVDELYVGVEEGAKLERSPAYRREVPVLFYGSSITQGGCASRPGNCYEAKISRRFDCDYLNFGFAGSAMGEPEMARYLSELDCCAFVFDYDHNAPDAAHLRATHEPFFLTVREAHPDLPVIMITKPDIPHGDATEAVLAERREIIAETCRAAIARGDKNVHFIDGSKIYDHARSLGAAPDDCTVDGTHPNDLGFACMAKVIGDKLAEVLGWTD